MAAVPGPDNRAENELELVSLGPDSSTNAVKRRYLEASRRPDFRPVAVQQPVPLSSFGIQDGQYVADASDFKKEFRPPTLPADLNLGYDQWKRADEEKDGNIAPLAHHIVQDRKYNVKDFQIISFRNNFNKIMGAPYSKNEWDIDIMRLPEGGSLVFNIRHLKSNPLTASDPQFDKFTYYGYKFEEVCTRAPDAPASVIDNRNQFCVAYKLKIGNYRLLLGAETDCYEYRVLSSPHGPEGPSKRRTVESYVELKSSKQIKTDKDAYNFARYKSISFWIQSFLVDVPHIIVGFRDDQGILQSISHYNTADLARNDHWDGKMCLFFLNEVLDFVAANVREEGTLYTLQARWPSVKLYKVKNPAPDRVAFAERFAARPADPPPSGPVDPNAFPSDSSSSSAATVQNTE